MEENTTMNDEFANAANDYGLDVVEDYPVTENPEDYHDGDMLIAAGIGAAGALGLGVLYQKVLKPVGKKAFRGVKKKFSELFVDDEEEESNDTEGEVVADISDEVEIEEVEEVEVVDTKKN